MEITKKTTKIIIEEMVNLLGDLNPNACFRTVPVLFGGEKLIVGSLPLEQLKLPEGCHYDSDRIMQKEDSLLFDGFYYTSENFEC